MRSVGSWRGVGAFSFSSRSWDVSSGLSDLSGLSGLSVLSFFRLQKEPMLSVKWTGAKYVKCEMFTVQAFAATLEIAALFDKILLTS